MKNEKALLWQLGLGAFYTTSTKNELPGYISEHLLISFLAGNSSKKEKSIILLNIILLSLHEKNLLIPLFPN